jgi:hypothetical protein
MTLRSVLGSLQLPVAGLGVLLVVRSVVELQTLPQSPPGSDGFVEGLAVLFLFVIAWVGLVLVAVGLAIPPGDGVGVRFTRWQRRLFVAAAGLAVASVVLPLVLWSVVLASGLSPSTVVLVWFGLMAAAVIALVGGVGWRAGQAAVRQFDLG